MPKYRYKCAKCKEITFVYHHISEKAEVCKLCNARNSLIKIPTMFTTENKNSSHSVVGEEVKKAIKEYGEEVSEEKNKLKEKIWKSDE